nr:hypothetical protein [Tanacetum cinerariifolium]
GCFRISCLSQSSYKVFSGEFSSSLFQLLLNGAKLSGSGGLGVLSTIHYGTYKNQLVNYASETSLGATTIRASKKDTTTTTTIPNPAWQCMGEVKCRQVIPLHLTGKETASGYRKKDKRSKIQKASKRQGTRYKKASKRHITSKTKQKQQHGVQKTPSNQTNTGAGKHDKQTCDTKREREQGAKEQNYLKWLVLRAEGEALQNLTPIMAALFLVLLPIG